MYKRISVKKLTGNERFKNTGSKDFSILDFWSYGFSNLSSNTQRGILAEFIIENALNPKEAITIRDPWGDYDILFNNKKIEVKCCSYIQDWNQKELSKVVFAGLKAKKVYYSSAGDAFPTEDPDYKADIYILALLKHKESETLDILNLSQWCFYILSREQVKIVSNNGARISWEKLEKNNIVPVSFQEIRERVLLM